MPNEYHLTLPVEKELVEKLRIKDIVYLTGIIVTGRDLVHKKLIDLANNNDRIPRQFDWVKGGAIYHMGPIVKRIGVEKNTNGNEIDNTTGRYRIVSGGPTTSSRMEPFQTIVNKILDIRFVIGKGGMKGVRWNETGSVYLQYPGGTGAITAKFVEEIVDVVWEDFGPEAAWFLKVKEFGPLLVAIDSKNESLFV